MLEEVGRRYWAPRRYDTLYPKAVTARDYRQAVPVVVTTLEQLTEHGAGAAMWRRLGQGVALAVVMSHPHGFVAALVRRPEPVPGQRASGSRSGGPHDRRSGLTRK
ncbi:hypothetical protein AB0F45_38470 [Streptomyces achromogenes]|uniref:hypothetical protein n=1 Tax=Streptomyces achromogenes TaxID=67255 RepID=UPI0033C3ECFA